MATEIAEHWGGSIHLEPTDAYDLHKTFSLINQSTEQIYVCQNEHSITQQKLIAIPEKNMQHYKPQSGSTYIIVGGTGGVGQLIMQQLSDAGADHFLLISSKQPKIAPTNLSIKVEHIQADISNFAALSYALKPFAHNKTIKGLIHAAGVLDDGLLHNQSLESYLRVAPVKVQGSWNLHILSQQFGWNLDFFIMFSSISSLFGTIGQANYAAANAFQNHLSAYRQQLGLKSTSILLGGLDNLGMSKTDSVTKQDIFERVNIQKISASFFIQALANIYQLPQAMVILQPMDFNKIKTNLFSPLQRSMISTPVANEQTHINEFRSHLHNQPASIRLEMIIKWLQELIANQINSPIEQLPLNTGFNELGLDSLMAVDVKEEVDKALDIKLPITSFFNSSTVVKLSQVILDLCIEETDDAPAAPSEKLSLQPHQEVTQLSEEDLAALIAAEFEQL